MDRDIAAHSDDKSNSVEKYATEALLLQSILPAMDHSGLSTSPALTRRNHDSAGHQTLDTAVVGSDGKVLSAIHTDIGKVGDHDFVASTSATSQEGKQQFTMQSEIHTEANGTGSVQSYISPDSTHRYETGTVVSTDIKANAEYEVSMHTSFKHSGVNDEEWRTVDSNVTKADPGKLQTRGTDAHGSYSPADDSTGEGDELGLTIETTNPGPGAFKTQITEIAG